MKCAFSPNFGMGTSNLIAIEPPSILLDNVAEFAFYDRIFIDGRSFEHLCGDYETTFFETLIAAGIVEVKDALYDDSDVLAAQAIFSVIFNDQFSKNFGGTIVDFSSVEPLQFERRLAQIALDVRNVYYLYLKNFCSLKASTKLGCPTISCNETDMALQQEILALATYDDSLLDQMPGNPSHARFQELADALDIERVAFPLCVDASSKRAMPMSAFNQMFAEESRPEWYAKHCIDPVESGRRLAMFLNLRQRPYFSGVQRYLLSADSIAAENRRDWFDALKADWAELATRPAQRALN